MFHGFQHCHTDAPLYIGKNGIGGYGKFNLDELSLWSTQFDSTQANQIYSDGRAVDFFSSNWTGPDPNLFLSSWFRNGDGIEDGQGSQMYDMLDSISASLNGAQFTSSSLPITPLTSNINGCDSTAILNLTVNNSNSGSSSVTACDSYVWDGLVYTYLDPIIIYILMYLAVIVFIPLT